MKRDRTSRLIERLLLYVAIAVAPTVVVWLGVRILPAAVTSFWERRRRTELPAGPCLESVVGNLRRLHRQVRDCRPPTMVRTVALLAAYDETLLEAGRHRRPPRRGHRPRPSPAC